MNQTAGRTQIQIGKEIGDVAESTLRFFRQIGVESIGMPSRYSTDPRTNPTIRPLIPPAQTKPTAPLSAPWDEEELRRVKQRIEAFGFRVASTNLPQSGSILLGHDDRAEQLAILKQNIRLAGDLGIPVMTYNFTALRASEGYGARYSDMSDGRGGADMRDFDEERIRGLPPLPSVGQHSLDEMWERIGHFLDALIPVAEEANVRLAVHPNDPPIPVYRGVAQPLGDLDGLKKLIDLVNSPANTVFFDTGVTTEMGEDAVEAIRYFGQRDRIGIVHFRNVRVEQPRYKYVETFHDNGDCDMFGCLQALDEVGYSGTIYPDHTPYLSDDTPGTQAGWAFAIGQMIGLRSGVTWASKQ